MNKTISVMTIAVTLLAAGSCLATEPAKATDLYSAGPFADPIRSAAENAVESVMFNNWLNENYASTNPDRKQGLREHLYSIIDTSVRQLYARDGVLLPEEKNEREMLAVLFRWALRMGVYSAPAVLRELRPAETSQPTGAARIPAPFDVVARGDLLTLSSKESGWKAHFPYHFMLMQLDRFESSNGLETQIAIISTGFGRHSSGEGNSQATIMLVYSPNGGHPSFDQYWLEQLGLTPSDASSDGPLGWPSYAGFDADRDLHTEVVFAPAPHGAMAVSFLGLSGTYEHNRPHFIDFLRALELPAAGAAAR